MRQKFLSCMVFISFFLFLFHSNQTLGASLPKMSHSQYIAGGIVSFLPIFGLGQAVQGRYGDVGWIMTVAEVGVLAVLIGSSMWTIYSFGLADTLPSSFEMRTAALSTTVISGVAFFGLYVWNVIDAWAYPKTHDLILSSTQMSTETKFKIEPVLAFNYIGVRLKF